MSQFLHILRKCFGVGFQIPSQRTGGEPVGSRSAPQSEVDAPRIECLESSELLSHDERRMVRQHDSTRAHTDRTRAAGDVRDQYSGRGTRNTGHDVMVRQPVWTVTVAYSITGKIDRDL